MSQVVQRGNAQNRFGVPGWGAPLGLCAFAGLRLCCAGGTFLSLVEDLLLFCPPENITAAEL